MNPTKNFGRGTFLFVYNIALDSDIWKLEIFAAKVQFLFFFSHPLYMNISNQGLYLKWKAKEKRQGDYLVTSGTNDTKSLFIIAQNIMLMPKYDKWPHSRPLRRSGFFSVGAAQNTCSAA